jgi:hypothetical protein
MDLAETNLYEKNTFEKIMESDKALQPTFGFIKLGLDGRSIGILHHQAASSGEVSNRCFAQKNKSVFKTSSVAGRTFFKYPNFIKPWTLGASQSAVTS